MKVILMENNPILKIRSAGPINEANIELRKINVVGGVNGSGKTTVAKILYCFLKVLSAKKDQYLHKELVHEFNHLIKAFSGARVTEYFENEDSYDVIKNKYDYVKKSFFENNLDKSFFAPGLSYDEGYASVFGKMDLLISLIDRENENNELEILKLLMEDEHVLNLFDSNIIFNMGLFEFNGNIDNYNLNCEEQVPDVFYMDTSSILDLKSDHILFKEHIRHLRDTLNEEPEWWNDPYIRSTNDLGELLDHGPKNLPNEIKEILSKIENIINGKYANYSVEFGFKKRNSEDITFTNNTPSGIKQIGVIQILLSNCKLKNGSYLIIDEPEVNLHPEWQFKFAEILVLLAKELNITLYLNSHSPMFIEAIEVLTQYYDVDDETNFYMTEKNDENTYNFKKVDYDNLYDLYDNLARPYEVIEAYRLKTEYKKGNY